MKNIAIIPARSGSKGLKDKNIKPLNGKPLIAYSIECAKASGLFDEVMVSTDSEEYADIARAYGANVPFLRSPEMSGDHAGSWDTVEEVLSMYRERGMEFETICLLQPTSPLRTKEDIIAGYRAMEEYDAEAVTSVCEVDHLPLWSMQLPPDHSLEEFNRNIEDLPRQTFRTYYRLNGAVYIRKIRYTETGVKVLDQKDHAFIMERSKSIDIDTMDDFELAEFYMNRK